MRRSEMIKILQNSFLEHMNCSYDCCSTDNELYSKILIDLEKHGMLPPYNPIGSESLEGHIQLCQWTPEKE